NDEAQAKGLSANTLVGIVGSKIGGRGGGKNDVAQGGGTDLSGIDGAFAAVEAEIAS
ncbi:MAG: DHHA1 domain-containing protein, partial [Aeromicrobium sp.]